MLQASGELDTVGGLMMLLFLSACAAAGDNCAEGPLPSVRDRLAMESLCDTDDDIPLAG